LESSRELLIRDEMSEKIVSAAENMVTESGAHSITVRKLLLELGITNRVFYNRFHNIDEVLEIVYKNTVLKIRESLKSAFDEQRDFFENVMEIATRSLLASYDAKQQFNQYVFESDSASQSNFDWWRTEIKKLLHYGMEQNYIKNVDPEIMSYSIWCFCRGYNADAVGRKLPRKEAVESFQYSFSILLDGLRA
jgi:AcrR family transcriptional regulator